MQAVYKSGGGPRQADAAGELALDQPSIVSLKIAPEQVARFERQGADLVLHLRDGQAVTVRGFFAEYADGGRNDLVLEDAAGVLWWGQYSAPWTAFHFAEIEWDDVAPLWLPPWLLAGLGVLGLGAALSGGGGGGGAGFVPMLPPNAAPTAPDQGLTTQEDSPVSGRVAGSDPNGDPLTYAKGSDPAHGTVVVNPDGTYTYTPNPDYHGPDGFTVIVDDGKGGTATATVTIEVTPVNDEPVPTDPNAGKEPGDPGYVPGQNFDPETGDYRTSTPEDTPVSGQVVGSDADGDELRYALGEPPAHGTVTVNEDGTWEYVPDPDYHGPDAFTVVIDDGHGGTTTATVAIEVTPVNDEPVPTDPNAGKEPGDPGYVPGQNFDPETGDYRTSTPEDTPVSGRVTGSDPDGDTLRYTPGPNGPDHGTVTVNPNGTYTYTPSPDFNGVDTFDVLVDDGHGGTAISTVTITVTPINDPPVPVDPNEGLPPTDPGYIPGQSFDPSTGNYGHTTPEDTPVSGRVVGEDADGDTLSYRAGPTPPANGTVVVNPDGTYTYTPREDYNGTDRFTVIVDDGHGGTATSTVTINVTPVNDLPVPVDPNEGLPPTDPGYIPGQSFDPSTGNYGHTTPEDTPVSGRVVGEDADGDTLRYTPGPNGPSNGSVTVNPDGTYTYTPGPDFNGTDSFDVLVDDGHGGTAISTVTVIVTPVNDPPVPVDPNEGLPPTDPGYIPGQSFDPNTGNYGHTTPEDTPVSGRVVGEDADGDTLTYAPGPNGPSHGTVIVNTDGTYTYTPGPNFNGSDTFDVIVDDGHGGTATSTVTITVTPVNDAPVAVDDGPVAVTEDTPATGNVLANDSDVDTPHADLVVTQFVVGGNTYQAGQTATIPDVGALVIRADGSYTFTPAPDYAGPVPSATYTVSDGALTDTAVLRFNDVSAVNDPPVFVDPSDPATPVSGYSFSYDENRPAGTALGTVQATDVDSATVSYSIDPASDPNGWYAIDPLSGVVTLTAAGAGSEANDFESGGNSQTITVVATDGDGGTTRITVTLDELDLNDNAPVVVNTTATVSEEGLPGGVPADPARATQTGTIDIGDADAGATLTVTLSGPPGLSSGGVPVIWSGDGTAGNPLIGTAGSKPVFEATIDNAGRYTVTLKGPLDHPAGGSENTLGLDLTVSVSDGVHTGTGTLAVTVEDDMPVAAPSAQDYVLPAQDSNILLVLDISRSMTAVDPGTTKTRMEIMKEAVTLMLDAYGALGDVSVRIVTFGQGASAHGSTWISLDAAKTYVDSLSANSGATHYSTALTTAEAAFADPGKIAGANNVAYFLTDGVPTSGYGITPAREASWTAFLNDNDVNGFAYGMGPAAPQGPIDPAAYDGRGSGADTDATVVTDTAQLPPILRDSVGVNTSGSVITSGGLTGDSELGADGGSLESVTVNGRTYHADGTVSGGTSHGNWDGATRTWTINTEGEGGDVGKGGKLVIGMDDGAYIYTPPLVAAGSTHVENVGFVLIDADGDTAGSTLTLTVHPAGTVLPQALGVQALAAPADDLGLAALDHGADTAPAADDAPPALHELLGAPTHESLDALLAGLPADPAAPAPAAMDVAGMPQADLAPYTPPPVPLDDELHHAMAAYH